MRQLVEKARKRDATPLVVAAIVALVLVAALAALTALTPDVVREGSYDAPFALDFSGIMVIGAAALAFWGVSADYRCASNSISRALRAATIAMILWLGIAFAITIIWHPADPPIGTIAVISDFIIAMALELCIDTGIIPSARRYRSLFQHLPLDLKILNPGGRVVFRTAIACTLDSTTLNQLRRHLKRTNERAADGNRSDRNGSGRASRQNSKGKRTSGQTVVSVRAEATPDSLYKLYPLTAGTALLTEDAGEINALQRRLEARREQLTAQNELLRRNHAVRSLVFRQQRERELHERVERDLASTAAQIRRILDNRVTGTSAEARAERHQQLNLVKVLVAYSKRKGMLALAAAESETLSAEQLELVAREAMADLRSIGIECGVLVQSPTPISVAAFNTVYDSFYDCILTVLPRTNPVVMAFISVRDDDTLELRVAIESAIGLEAGNAVEMIPAIATSTEPWKAVQMRVAHDLEGRLAMRGGDYAITLDDGLVNVTVRVVAPDSEAPDSEPASEAPASDSPTPAPGKAAR